MARLLLIAVGDDFLLEEALRSAVEQAVSELDGAPIEELSPECSPEDLAVEINSPSLFSPQRVLVLPQVQRWVDAPAAPDAPKAGESGDLKPLVYALKDKLPEDLAVVMGAWCGGPPKGELAEVIAQQGEVRWIPMPEAPKPWDPPGLSMPQMDALRAVMRRAAPSASLAPAAEKLLCNRMGFAPRRLAVELKKLHAASGGARITETLVRQLVLPKDGSIEIFSDCILQRDATALSNFLDLARRGIPIRDYSGERLGGWALRLRLLNTAAESFLGMLYLREQALLLGAEAELRPEKNGARGWYQKVFKTRLGPALSAEIKKDDGSPFRKAPTLWRLHLLFRGAGRYPGDVLTKVVRETGKVELDLRQSEDDLAPLWSWLAGALLE